MIRFLAPTTVMLAALAMPTAAQTASAETDCAPERRCVERVLGAERTAPAERRRLREAAQTRPAFEGVRPPVISGQFGAMN